MKIYTALFVAIGIISSSFAQTIVSDTVSGVWSKANSPYIVTGDIIVLENDSLIIEPGVEVRFAGKYKFLIYRSLLKAIGAPSDTIVFTNHHPDSLWNRIHFDRANDGSELSYVKVEHSALDGIECYQTNLKVTHSLITDNGETNQSGIYVKNGAAIINNSTIRRSSGKGIYAEGSLLVVSNSIISENNDGAIHCGGCPTYLYKTQIFGNAGRGTISLFSFGAAARIDNCLIADNYANDSLALILHFDGSVNMTNSIVWNSGFFEVGNTSSLIIDYSDIEGGYEGIGNIDNDPLFLDAANGDFHLQNNSSCIDTGHPSAFYNDLDGSQNDMGAFGGSGISLTPANIDYSFTGRGQLKTKDLYFYNFRNTSLNLNSATLTDPLNFSTNFTAPMVIAPVSKDSITVTFQPDITGVVEEQIIFESPDLIGANNASVSLKAYAGVWGGDVSGVWSLSNSPIIMGGDLRVPFEETLTIEPGVVVQVDTNFAGSSAQFIVEGFLFAEGTEISPITFSTVPGQETPGLWDGLHLLLRSGVAAKPAMPGESGLEEDKNLPVSRAVNMKEADRLEQRSQELEGEIQSQSDPFIESVIPSARLVYCNIEYASTAITAESDSVLIDHCRIANNSEHGIMWFAYEEIASGRVLNSVIENNGGWGIFCHAICEESFAAASPYIYKNRIINNTAGGIYLYAEGEDPFTWTGTIDRARVSPVIENNEIQMNQGNAIEGLALGSWVDGIPFDHYSYAYTEPVLIRNTITNNVQGIYTRSPGYENGRRLSFSEFDIDRATFWMNGNLTVHSADSANVTIRNSILWEAGASGIQTNNGGTVSASYSDIQGGYTGTGNINADPQFVDPLNGDFNLDWTSPAIDAGVPDTLPDPDGTIADMGAHYYHQSLSDFSLQSPENDSTITTLSPTFQWQQPATTGNEPLVFDLYYSTSSAFIDSLTTIHSNLPSNSHTLSEQLQDFTTYYWEVLAKNPWSLEKFSLEAWQFHVNTDTLPPVFTANLPPIAFNEDDSLIFHTSNWYEFVEDNSTPDSLLSFSIQSGNFVTASIENDTAIFKSLPDWFGTDTLYLIVGDRNNLTSSAPLVVHVNSINDPPIVLDIPSIEFPEDSSYSFDLDAYVTDVDHDTTEISWSFAFPSNILASIENQRVHKFSSKRQTTSKSALDLDDSRKKLFQPLNQNDLKIISYVRNTSLKSGPSSSNAREGHSKTLEVPGITTTHTLGIQMGNNDSLMITINDSTHIASITATANFYGYNFSVMFTAIDDSGATDTDTTTISVSPVNDPPQITTPLPDLAFNEDDTLSYPIENWFPFVNDPDHSDGELSYFVISGGEVTVEPGNAVYHFYAPENWFGPDTMQLIVSDTMFADTADFYITVISVNDTPTVMLPDSIAFPSDSSYVLNIWDYVEDVETPDSLLIYQISTASDSLHSDYNNSTGYLTLWADSSFIGATYLYVTVADDSNATAHDSLKVIVSPITGIDDPFSEIIPQEYILMQNYPNPFNPITHIRFGLPRTSHVKLIVYNLLGQRVAVLVDERRQAGYHVIDFDSRNFASGLYFYHISAEDFHAVKKMILLK